MAGELLKAVKERQDNVKRMVARLVEELEALVMKFSYESPDGPIYHFEFNEVSLLYVSVTLLRNEKPVAIAWTMYHTDRNQFAFSECEPSGEGRPRHERLRPEVEDVEVSRHRGLSREVRD